MSSTDDQLKVDLREGSDPQHSTETKKPKKQSKCQNFFSNNRFGGIPFAILYGFYLYFVMTNLILTDDTAAPSVSEALHSNGKTNNQTNNQTEPTIIYNTDCSTETISKNDDQLWKIETNKLTNKGKDELKSPATGDWKEEIVKNETIYLVKVKSSKVLGETSGVVELQVRNSKIAASQLWIKGTPNAEGFYTLKNNETSQFLRATYQGVFGVEGADKSTFLRNQLIGASLGVASSIGLGIGSVWSKRLRCSLILILPGLFSGRGRAMLMTLATGVLIDGPVTGISYNSDVIVGTVTCMYSNSNKAFCGFKETLTTTFKDVKTPINAVKDVSGVMKDVCNGGAALIDAAANVFGSKVGNCDALNKLNLDPKKLFNMEETLQGLKPKFTGDIKEKKNRVTETFKTTGKIIKTIISYCKKIFYIATLLFMMYDGYNYLLKYRSDDSFDNTDVDRSLRYLWENENYEELTPLRNWEKEETKVSRDVKLTKAELRRIFRLTMPSMVFSGLAIALILADAGLAAFLGLIRNSGQGIKGQASTVTNKCLPNPLETDVAKFAFLACIILLCFVTCFSDAYSRRWRSMICNLFYPETAMARARYLYAKIVAGRFLRKVKLKSIAIREKKRQDFEEENSISGRMKCCIGMCKCCAILLLAPTSFWIMRLCCGKGSKIVCHGCGFKVESQSTNEEEFTAFDGKMVTVTICEDCKKDLDTQGKAVEGISLEEFGVAMKNDDF